MKEWCAVTQHVNVRCLSADANIDAELLLTDKDDYTKQVTVTLFDPTHESRRK